MSASLLHRIREALGGPLPFGIAIVAALAGLAGLIIGLLADDVAAAVSGLAAGALVLLVVVGQAAWQHFDQAESRGVENASLRAALDALPAGVLLFDSEERLLLYNRAALESSPALRHGAAIGMTYSEIVKRTYERAAEFGAPLANTPEEWITRFRSKGAIVMRQAIGRRWFEWSERATANGGTVALRTDITSLIQREQEIERARGLLQETLDALPAGVALYDKDERLLLCNKTLVSLNPMLADPACIGMAFPDLARKLIERSGLKGEAAETMVQQWLVRFRSGNVREIFQLGDGRWIEVSERRTPYGGTVGLRLDITDLKKHEQEIDRARSMLQETLDALPAGVTLYDREGRLVTSNKAARSVNPKLGRPEAAGRTFEELSRELRLNAGQSGKALEDGVRRAVSRFRGDGSKDVFQVADGRWIEASEHGTESGFTVGLRLDVSELRAREREILRARDYLQETLDLLPAGVELYDKNERLTVVNKAAIDISCGVLTAQSVGMTFTELAHYAETIQTATTPDPLTAEARIERFRTKGQRHVRRAADGRWIERFEQSTPGGGTIGLRVDVSDLKNREVEIERTRVLLQETLDALPAGVTLWDKDERLVMFNEVAAGINPRVREQIGQTYSEIVGALVKAMEQVGRAAPPDWLKQFRSRAEKRIMQAPDGRWFEWSERLTSSGHTVGLRADVTELKQREEELERSQAEYRALVESMSDAVYAVDDRGRFTFLSAAAAELYGRPVSELLGTRLIDTTVPDDVERAILAGREFMRSTDTGVRQIELRLKHPNGGERLVEVRYRKPAKGGDPRIAQVGVIRDVTERAQLMQRLERQMAEVDRARADYQLLVDSLSDVVYRVDARGHLMFASAAAKELLGIEPEKLVGRPLLDFVAPEDLDALRDLGRRVHETTDGTVHTVRLRLWRPEGGTRWIELRSRNVLGEDGRSAFRIGIVRDIDKSIMMEQRLDEEMERLRSIVESSGASMLLVDRDLNIVMANREFWKSSGFTPEDTIGRPFLEKVQSAIDPSILYSWLAGPLTPEQMRPVQYTKRRPDPEGRERVLGITATPIVDSEKRLQQIVFLSVDDTERRDAEQLLVDTERLATVGEMASTVAHEIAQPLQVINIAGTSAGSEIELARAEGKAPDIEFIASKIARIADQVERASKIVGELRSFVRGSATDEATRFDPAEALKSAVELTRHAAQLAGAEMHLNVDGRLPDVSGHLTKLEQVLVNLINNARDAGAKTIEVEAGAIRRDGRMMVRIAVDDSGPGIAPHIMPRLFESFVTTKPRGKGTGLGLRICRRIVEEMGGTISAANRDEGGARFEILLPPAIPAP